MIRKIHEGIEWLEFEIFSGHPLKQGVFLRHGGLSQGHFSSFNLSHGMGDDPRYVNHHLNKVMEILNVPKICWTKQVHGNEILMVGPGWENGQFPSDAMMTHHVNFGLMINHADCQAAIMYDPIQHALAVVHCGWRGSVLNVYQHAIHKMSRDYGTKPADLLIGISPSLGPENAEFIHYKTELPEHFWEYQVKPNYFNFWLISEMQLKDCGVLASHIEIAGINTYAHPEDFYSYRRSKMRGGNGTVASLI
jgi:polyphenol oxidase